MKKSELKKSIQEEIFEILAEADQEDIDAQADLNKELEATKGHRDDLGDSLSESLNPEVIKALDRFIKAMAKRYGYSEQDAVFAIQAALNQRKKLVRKYKDAEEPEKSKMLARLKELTKIKKELEGLL